MPSYDIVVGLDNSTLNAELAAIYHAVYPALFKGTIGVDKLSITNVDFDVQGPPTADLTPSHAARSHLEKLLADSGREITGLVAELPPHERAALLDWAVRATFSLSVSELQLTVNYSGDTKPVVLKAGFTLAASIETGIESSGQNYLTFQAITGKVSIPDNPALADFVNHEMPELVSYLNANVLAPLKIPTLQYHSLVVSIPIPVVQNGYALAFSALGTAQPDVPAPYDGWPTQTVFAGLDAAVLVAAANTVLPIGPSTHFSWQQISGTASATIGPVGSDGVTINGDGSLSVRIPCNALAQLTLSVPPLPDYHFGPSATVTLAATGSAAVVAGQVQITINSVDQPKFDFSWGNIPFWIWAILEPELNGLANALGGCLASLITLAISGLTVPVATEPVVTVPIAGSTYDLFITDVSTKAAPSPAGTQLLALGTPSITRNG